MENALRGLGNEIDDLNNQINSGKLSGQVLEKAKTYRSTIQKQKDLITDRLNKAKQEAKKKTG